jgi:GTP-binding protein HflX
VLADLIVHVIDAAEPSERRGESIAAVDTVLEEIGAGGRPRLLAYNKVDLLADDERQELLVGEPDAVAISAESGEGMDELRDRIEEAFEERLEPVRLLVPYSAGDRLSELHRIAGDLEREDHPEGVLVRARIPSALSHRFAEFAVDGDRPGATRRDGAGHGR